MPVFVVLAGLVLAELVMRVAAAHLPPILEWPDWETQNKVAAIDRLASRGGASIVTVGSSIVDAGMDPVTLGRAAVDDRPAFNAALGGSNIRSTARWTMQVVVPRLHPRVVVIGVDDAELNGSGKEELRFYDLLLRSVGWQRIAGGSSLYDRIRDRAVDWSYVVRYRAVLRKPSRWFSVDTGRTDAAVGRLGNLLPRKPAKRKRFSNFNMFTKDYLEAPVGRARLAALGGLIDWLDARGIQVVVVRMPTVDERQGAVAGSAVYPRIEATLSSFFAAHRLRALDLRPSFTTDDLFFDTHHVNPQGRRKLNEILLRFLQAPSG